MRSPEAENWTRKRAADLVDGDIVRTRTGDGVTYFEVDCIYFEGPEPGYIDVWGSPVTYDDAGGWSIAGKSESLYGELSRWQAARVECTTI